MNRYEIEFFTHGNHSMSETIIIEAIDESSALVELGERENVYTVIRIDCLDGVQNKHMNLYEISYYDTFDRWHLELIYADNRADAIKNLVLRQGGDVDVISATLVEGVEPKNTFIHRPLGEMSKVVDELHGHSNQYGDARLLYPPNCT